MTSRKQVKVEVVDGLSRGRPAIDDDAAAWVVAEPFLCDFRGDCQQPPEQGLVLRSDVEQRRMVLPRHYQDVRGCDGADVRERDHRVILVDERRATFSRGEVAKDARLAWHVVSSRG